jgi:hypothetical protein
VVSSSTPNPTATSTNTPVGTVANRSTILINEVQCNPFQSGADSSYEWVEIYNPGSESVTLAGWLICDNRAADAIPEVVLQANGLAIVAASQNFSVNFPDYEGTIVFITDGRIGNGMGNGGDCLILKDSAGTTIDEISYGDDDSITSLPWPEVADGHSLERKPCGGQFVDNDAPTPGHCLPEVIGYADSAGLSQVSPMSDESDSVVMNQQQSMELPLSAASQAHMSSSIDEPVDYHSISLSSLLFTLSSALVVISVWMLHRKKAR